MQNTHIRRYNKVQPPSKEERDRYIASTLNIPLDLTQRINWLLLDIEGQEDNRFSNVHRIVWSGADTKDRLEFEKYKGVGVQSIQILN